MVLQYNSNPKVGYVMTNFRFRITDAVFPPSPPVLHGFAQHYIKAGCKPAKLAMQQGISSVAPTVLMQMTSNT